MKHLPRAGIWLLILAAGGALPSCGDSEPGAGDGGVGDGDGGPGGSDGGGGWHAKNCATIYQEDQFPTFEIRIDPAEWNALHDEFLNWEERQEAGLDLKPYHPLIEFRQGDQVAADAMIRLRGNPCCSWTDDKMQFQVSFNENDPDGRFLGLRKVLFDAPRYNRSFLRQRVALSFLRDLGLPAPCSNNSRLMVNGEYYGLYENLEKVDREFLERNFPDPDGNLYKKGYELVTNEETGDVSRQMQFWATFDVAGIEELVDLDQAVLMWASDAIIPNSDGYWSGGGNFYLYDDPTRGKFVFVPWDIDSSFEVLPADTDPFVWIKPIESTGRPHFEAVMDDPTWRGKFLDALEESLDAYDPAVLQERIDRWAAQIRDAAASDPHKQFTTSSHEQSVSNLRAYIPERADWIRGWIPTQR
jgi:hypothetical protein